MSLVPHTPTTTRARTHTAPVRTNTLLLLEALSDRINSTSDEHALMRVVVEGLMGMLHARAGLMMLSGASIYTRHRETSEALLRLETLLRTDGGCASVFVDPRQRRPSDLPRELLLVPIRWRERTEGVLAFDMGRRRILTSERSLVRLVANQLGAAFRTREASAASSPEAMQLQGSLQAAASVQQSLLPVIPSSQVCGLSIAACTIPAEVVGGDYYDFICVEKKKLGIVIADIQGKGLAAALFGNLLRTTTHFLTRESPSPAVLLGKINTILHREATSTRKLFTMFYAMYDARTGLLTYSGSGHVSPVVVPHNGSAPHRLRSDGTLFGVSAVQMFREHSTYLAAGDLVVFFTDGVIEHAARDGEAFGEDRLLRTLMEVRDREPEAIVQVVKEKLHAFAPLPSSDDITIIVARVV